MAPTTSASGALAWPAETMRYCASCDHILNDPGLESCPSCGEDPPASGWPDDGVTLPAGLGYTPDKRLSLRDEGLQRYALEASEWTLTLTTELTAERRRAIAELTRLAAVRLCGVVAAGLSGETAWWVREQPRALLSEILEQHERQWAATEASAAALAFARVLQAHAQAEEPLSGLSPERMGWEPTMLLSVSALSATASGATSSSSGSRALGRWGSPQHQDGEAWTFEDGVYSLGLILYRMLAGRHPFKGMGLRERLRRQGAGEVPPMPEAVLSGLPPGLNGLVMQMLDGQRSARPSLDTVIETLESYAAGRLLQPQAPVPEESSVSEAEPESVGEVSAPEVPPVDAPSERSSWVNAAALCLVLLGAGVLLWAVSGGGGASSGSEGAVEVGAAQPMDVRSSPEDCATCHPNHAVEWERSVMAHAARSPLFGSLEMVIEEQIGRSFDCPNGAGVLRRADPATACRDPNTGFAITGSGGEHWCINCHFPLERRLDKIPAWNGVRREASLTRFPAVDMVGDVSREGITCTFCHQVTGPARASADQDGYLGNATWRSFLTGQIFDSRPEARRGKPGIGNSGYYHDPNAVFDGKLHPESPALVHGTPAPEAVAYLKSSEFCGTCHDVRIFGTDMIGAGRGEHFKRLRNAYSEWEAWRDQRTRVGQEVHSCQDCHMSLFPGICDPNGSGGEADGCPEGTGFVAKGPGSYALGGASTVSPADSARTIHYFTGVDVPMTPSFDERWSADPTLDVAGLPLGVVGRRDLLLKNTFRFELGEPAVAGSRLTVPLLLENIAGGHRVPAGFSQEREIWVHLKVSDANGRVVYEVGRVDREDQDLRDKVFLAVNSDPDRIDGNGAPLGLFGANVADGPDAPQWNPPPERGGSTVFRGKGLINLQNGFLRCVRCIGQIDARGRCQPLPGQEFHRAARFADGDYDLDTGACRSNLVGDNRFFEVYFPVGALDADRGGVRGPDAIIDTRSLPPEVPHTYVYELETRGFTPPFEVEAELQFRAFPPFLIRAFVDYERRMAAKGLRPSGPLMTPEMLGKLEVVTLEEVSAEAR